MPQTTNKPTIQVGERVREYFKVSKSLLGFITYTHVTHQESLGEELHIVTEVPVKVFLNGKELK